MSKVKKKSTKPKTEKNSTQDSNHTEDDSTKKPVEYLVSEKKRKNFGKEIDEIFENAGKKKKESGDVTHVSKQKEGIKGKREVEVRVGDKMKKRKGGDLDGALFEVGDMESEKKQNRRKTNNGMAIYSSEELGINNPNAGGTPLCPFDCDCCF